MQKSAVRIDMYDQVRDKKLKLAILKNVKGFLKNRCFFIHSKTIKQKV